MKILDAIPADSVIEMTAELIRAFRICDCDPHCHCCGDAIEAGTEFRLALIESSDRFYSDYIKRAETEDEMLCQNCTAKDLIAYKKREWQKGLVEYEARNNGYTRIHHSQ